MDRRYIRSSFNVQHPCCLHTCAHVCMVYVCVCQAGIREFFVPIVHELSFILHVCNSSDSSDIIYVIRSSISGCLLSFYHFYFHFSITLFYGCCCCYSWLKEYYFSRSSSSLSSVYHWTSKRTWSKRTDRCDGLYSSALIFIFFFCVLSSSSSFLSSSSLSYTLMAFASCSY